MSFMNLKMSSNDKVSCLKAFDKLSGRFAFCLSCMYARHSIVICLIVGRVTQNAHIGESFSVIKWLCEI